MADNQEKILNVMLPPLNGGDMKTVKQIKEEIQALTQIPMHKQLLFMFSSKDHRRLLLLHESTALEDPSFYSPTLDLIMQTKIDPPKKIPVTVHFEQTGEDISVEIMSDATLVQLMQMLDLEVGVAPSRQSLSFHLWDNYELDTYVTNIQDCKLEDLIPHGAVEQFKVVLKVTRKRTNMAPLTVKFASDKDETVLVELEHDTPSSLKHEIKKLRPNWMQQRAKLSLVTSMAKSIDDGALTLEQSGLKSGDELYVFKD